MRRVIVFVTVLALCLGLLVFTTAAMNDAEDELTFTPLVELGDISPIAGRSVGMDFHCGNHMTWHTQHTFGGGTEAGFVFTQFPEDPDSAGIRNEFDVWFAGGVGAGTSGGNFPLAATGYGQLMRTVAAITANGERRSMHLKMADYADYYLPDINLNYESDALVCNLNMDLSSLLTDDYSWSNDRSEYDAFFDHFRFPVQEDTIVEVSIEKDEVGNITGIGFYPENAPQLYFVTTVNETGLYFVPIFRDAAGNPLTGEYPDGLGIYYIPWKDTGNERSYNFGNGIVVKTLVRPDAENAVNRYPLPAGLDIQQLEISDDASTAWMLTREDGKLWFSVLDLENRREVNRFEVLPAEESTDAYSTYWTHNGRWMMVCTAADVALIDLTEDCSLVMTSPVQEHDGRYAPWYADGTDGIIEYDGEHLVLMNTLQEYDGAFWVLVCRQGEEVFYGEYTCSILQGNDSWYYASIFTDDKMTFE